MPKEQKKRGRREVKKRKVEHDEKAEQEPTPPTLTQAIGQQDFITSTDEPVSRGGFSTGGQDEKFTFYGLLDEQESEYFRKADEMLELNQFGDPEERSMFIANVYKEAEGKELKLANSQGCSRLMEKLILLSSPGQLKKLFQKFSGHFPNLITHRFASHCCETLFLKAAPIVTSEMDPLQPQETGADDIFVSMENLFLFTLAELEPPMDDLLMDRFASHVLRTLFVVLAGQPLDDSTLRPTKKKEKVSLPSSMIDTTGSRKLPRREVPAAFHEAISRIVDGTTTRIAVEDLRKLAIDPLASPTLQLFIEIDMSRSRKYRSKAKDSLVGKLMLPSPEEEERVAETRVSFAKSLLYDTVGSHLFETVIRTSPKRTFQELYDTYFKGKMGPLSHHETGFYVLQRVFEKSNPDILKGAVNEISTEVKELMDENKVAVVKSLLDACKKNDVNASEIDKALQRAFVDEDKSQVLLKILKIKPEDLDPLEDDDKPEVSSKKRTNPSQLHGSLLAQSLLDFSVDAGALIRESVLAQSPARLVRLAEHPLASHVLEKALTNSTADLPYKRKFVSLLQGNFARLAQHSSGSHVVDACAVALLIGMNHNRQRIAGELAAAEAELRDSFFGRAVWRNWKMDVYNTRRGDWVKLGKRDGQQESTPGANSAASDGAKKSAIQLAAERHAAKKAQGDIPKLSAVNATSTATKRKHEVVA